MMGRERQVERQLELVPGGVGEQVYAGGREMLGLVD